MVGRGLLNASIIVAAFLGLGVCDRFESPRRQSKRPKRQTLEPATKTAGCPADYVPTNLKCFRFGVRLLCGMARPNSEQNCLCGAAFQKYKLTNGGTIVIDRCRQKTPADAAKLLGAQSESGAIKSILQRAFYYVNREITSRRIANSHITLVSLDHKERDEIVSEAAEVGFSGARYSPVVDFESPTPETLEEAVEMMLIEATTNVLIHCGGGMGRTGFFLIALVLTNFWHDGHKNYKDVWNVVHYGADEQRPVYEHWWTPFEEAVVAVQEQYHPDAGEFLEVDSNFLTLVNYVHQNKDYFRGVFGSKPVSEKLLPELDQESFNSRAKAFLVSYKQLCEKLKGGNKKCYR